MSPTSSAWSAWAAEESGRIQAAGRWRVVRDLAGCEPDTVLHGPGGDRPVVSFAGNDYLGLARHPAVVAAALDAVARWGTGAGAARLLAGARPVHRQLEAALADWKQAEDAVLFPTGYAANLG
ncbi:MAG: aminotransferase class I/II-fold pyridoxal phosphate-dependent enzyme, partial [Acidimicrobiales bacterium]